ncbi:heavy metal translocating P-type ATPase [Hyphomicrobium sp. CS1BSMeth3]|uniref:heavy metal translocating P-type ATPase n=1 Tax=Hyphomicrobium sp. CS1BSMeth3 TaxID=1892844 RepID=UPI000930A802|nr:heavy metal translocating P-type ATPase [Hyphomicrobium sp. CS1BSMeth3]
MAETLSVTTLRDVPDDAAQNPRALTLVVEGMHCGNCMRKVERTLQAVPGVVAARVNLSNGRAHVTAAPAGADLDALVEALRGVGFKAYELVEGTTPAHATHDAEYLRRLGVAGFAASNIMLMSVAVWAGIASDMDASLKTLFHWLSAMVAIPAVAYAGQPFFRSAARALRARQLNMDVPISLGVLLATGMSLYQTTRGSDQVYFDAAVTLLFFLLIGRYLDIAMRSRASSAAQNLLGLRATSATVVLPDGTTQRLPTRDVVPGMRILVAAGERIPVDARINRGIAEVDESLITGESRPRRVAPGDLVYSGTISVTGTLETEAIAREENTLLADISRLMGAAEQARGRYVRLADRASRLYAPAVHLLGLGTFIGWMLLGYGWEPALTAAVAVLIITCPCALALAVPAVQVVASGRLFRNGIILKAADGLERMAEIDTIVLDKTGTLTLGEPRLIDSTAIDDRALERAASIAASSRHPYSRAIVAAAKARGIPVVAEGGVEEIAGAGLAHVDASGETRLGSAQFCEIADTSPESGSTIWLRTSDGRATAFHFTDPLRADAAEVVGRLRDAGFHMEILSGDGRAAVAEAAQAVGIANWQAGLKPADKIVRIDQLKAEGRKVLMVGDGLNDAPALAAGHASLSPASAADISQTAADAVFQGERLAPIIEALLVAHGARRRALENFGIAIGYNFIFVPLAVIGLATPLIAAIAMSASSIAVTANALRLSRQRLGNGLGRMS